MVSAVAIALIALAAAVRVNAQCDPAVCANPYSSQVLPSLSPSPSPSPVHSGSGKKLPAAVQTDAGDGVSFASLSLQLQIPPAPTVVYPWVGVQYYAEFTGLMQLSNGPDPSAFVPVVLSATLAFDASFDPPVYVATCGLSVDAPGFNNSGSVLNAPYGTLYVQLLNTNTTGTGERAGLQVVMADAGPIFPQHVVFSSGYTPTAMADGAQVQMGMRVQTAQGTLADTPCTVLPPAPFQTQFSNISLDTTAGPVPLTLSVTPVTDPWCSLTVSADDAAAVTTFQWADH